MYIKWNHKVDVHKYITINPKYMLYMEPHGGCTCHILLYNVITKDTRIYTERVL